MTRNPYAQMGDHGGTGQGGDYGDFGGQPPARTSALAVASLIVSIVGLVVCCIPGPGILGMFLAVGAVISISTSNGRRTGMGMAIAGLVLGLLATILSVLIWVGMSMFMSSLTGYGPTMEAIWRRDVAATAQSFEPAAAAQITPERIETFVQQVESELGAYQGMPQGMGGFWAGYRQVGPHLQVVNQQSVVPVPAEFDNGYGAVLLEFPPNMGPGSPLRNLGVILPRSQSVVWLIERPTASPLPAPPSAPPAAPLPPDAPADGALGEPGATDDEPAAPEPADPEGALDPSDPVEPESPSPEDPAGGGR